MHTTWIRHTAMKNPNNDQDNGKTYTRDACCPCWSGSLCVLGTWGSGISCQLRKITRARCYLKTTFLKGCPGATKLQNHSRILLKIQIPECDLRPTKAESQEVGARNLHFNTLPRRFLKTPKYKHY